MFCNQLDVQWCVLFFFIIILSINVSHFVDYLTFQNNHNFQKKINLLIAAKPDNNISTLCQLDRRTETENIVFRRNTKKKKS